METIVKIQLSIYTDHEVRQMLVYNEDRSIEHQCDAEMVIMGKIGQRHKAYFKAHLKDDGTLVVGDEVDEEDW